MKTRKRFKEYSNQLPINESTWLSKGFAIGQGSRHEATKRQLESTVGRIHSICNQGKIEDELDKKLDLLFEALSKIADGLKNSGELSKSVINVGIASNLLEDDLRTLLKQR